MGFRNPITSAIDQTARDLANQALTGIIPGTRLAADAINGMTITGALIQTAATGQRVAIGVPGMPNAVAFYSGDADEHIPGSAQGIKIAGNTTALDTSQLSLAAPNLYAGDDYESAVFVRGSTRDGSIRGSAIMQAGGPSGATLPPRLTVGPTGHAFTGAPTTFSGGLTQFACGTVSITPSAANTPTGKAITFGKTFAAAPAVFVCAQSSNPGTLVTETTAQSITTTGATVYLTRTDTATSTVMWLAVGYGI